MQTDITPAIKELVALGEERGQKNTPRTYDKLPVSSRGIHFITKDNDLSFLENMPPDRKHTVFTIADIVQAAEYWGSDPTATPVVYVCANGVRLILDDDAHRFDSVFMGLTFSPVFELLLSMQQKGNGGGALYNQVAWLRLLRLDLRSASNATTMLSGCKNIKFSRRMDSVSSIDHGRDSLGKSVEQEVSGADKIEQKMTVPVRVYDDPSFAIESIDLDIEIVLAGDGGFRVTPYPGQLDAAIRRALQQIIDKLREDLPVRGKDSAAIPVFMGTP